MRKFVTVFFFLAFILSSISMTAYAGDCTKDTLIDKFGDWFGNFNKPEGKKQRNIAVRRANRLAECAEKNKTASGK